MRFKIDENLPDALVALLTERGYDASTARQERLHGRPDLELAAASEGVERDD